jgi:hypothetical protein
MWTHQYYWSIHIFHHNLSDSNNIRGSRYTGSVWKRQELVRFRHPNWTAIKQSGDVQRKSFAVPPSQQVRRFRWTPSLGKYCLPQLAQPYLMYNKKGVLLSYRFRISRLQPDNNFQWVSPKNVPHLQLLLIYLHDVLLTCVSRHVFPYSYGSNALPLIVNNRLTARCGSEPFTPAELHPLP